MKILKIKKKIGVQIKFTPADNQELHMILKGKFFLNEAAPTDVKIFMQLCQNNSTARNKKK